MAFGRMSRRCGHAACLSMAGTINTASVSCACASKHLATRREAQHASARCNASTDAHLQETYAALPSLCMQYVLATLHAQHGALWTRIARTLEVRFHAGVSSTPPDLPWCSQCSAPQPCSMVMDHIQHRARRHAGAKSLQPVVQPKWAGRPCWCVCAGLCHKVQKLVPLAPMLCAQGRTDNAVKNHWNATWRSKLVYKPHSMLVSGTPLSSHATGLHAAHCPLHADGDEQPALKFSC